MLLHLLILSLFTPYSEGCMPGFEAERDRLREHLGIEWKPHGLDKHGFTEGKHIRHDYDINCNFTDFSKCKWKNAGASEGLDSRDFHLFEKEDYTEWPTLQVHPGPSKIDVGDRMILVGDRTRDEQHALIYSTSIPCQTSPGNLTFTYWAYNNARIEVVLLETVKPKTKGKPYRKLLPDKPYVDCGTVPLNTNCHAEIPERETPFHIGFRAYDISNTQGSFIILDSILYSATLCKVSIDLGKNFESKPLVTSAHGEFIHKATDLLCVHFDLSCRWRSGGKASPMWRRSTVPLSDDFVMQVTGTKIAPKGAYSVLYIEQDSPTPYDILRSDAIECEASTGNEFTYRYWTTKDVKLEVCALSMDTDTVIECHRSPSGVSPVPVSVSFKKATKRFYIAIRVVSLNSNVDNAIVVDDISYQSTLCHEAVSAVDLGPTFVTTPMLSVLLGKHVSSAKDMWCDFSKRATDCSWGNVATQIEDGDEEETPIAWTIGNGPLDNEKFYSLTGQTLMPAQEFAVAKFDQAGSSLLLSEVILCVSNTASLSFHLWTTGVATLRICLVEENSSNLLDCQPINTGPVTVELPRVERPFKISLRADSDAPGMVIIDDLQVNGDICNVPRQYSAKAFRPNSLTRPDGNVCRLLSCSFKRGHPCLYDNSQLEKSAQFEVTNGILIAELNATRPIAILESTPFQLNTISRLHFIYSVFGDVALFVCNDSAGKELENCFRVDGTGGDDYVELLPSDTKVYLLGRLLKKNSQGTLQIKRLSLTDPEDVDAC